MLRHSLAGGRAAGQQRRAAAAGSSSARAAGACSSSTSSSRSSSRRRAVYPAAATDSSSSSTAAAPAPLRTALAAAAAAALLLAPGSAWAAAPARAPLPRADLAELAAAVDVDEDAIIDQYNSDMEDLAQGTPKDLGKLEAARERAGFRRGADGRVALLSDGEEFEVKADAQAPGFLLLRDSRGYCYYLPPDPSGRLRQIDLSDDVVVAQLFANGMWQEIVEPLEVLKAPKDGENASASDAVQLRLTEPEWRGVLSLLEGGRELPEEPLEDLEADD
ncbi:hypothetical protein Rsub_06372 [Raphidocelis subcapitata]|uniref:Uncharacterized protein n=1 Tax=Raphidocelis subcapitata TaxID=307507 RepID=A0A2V0P0E1_9CHLO|nr:hypothetical protein Rsub_06372 [Raphidocelis subcapitata]|eukprot:GBF93334.1 hypothetical protein Rsub_06372 [Raphidocelis subcapitata]